MYGQYGNLNPIKIREDHPNFNPDKKIKINSNIYIHYEGET